MQQEEIIKGVVNHLESLNIPYMFTGAIAVNYYGIPRFTHDLDIIIELDPQQADPLIERLKDEFFITKEGILDALIHHSSFNAIHHKTFFKVDFWMVKQTKYDRLAFGRHQKKMVFDKEMRLISPEDLIIKKLLWYKDSGLDKHYQDVLGIVKVQGNKLDYNYITTWAEELGLKELLKETGMS